MAYERSGDYILAIDLGSGGPKAALAADDGRILCHARRAIATHILSDGGGEQDAEEWMSSVDAAARDALAQSGLRPEQIVAVACASQWSVIAPVDSAGNVLHRAIHWTDSRGARHTRAMMNGLVKVAGYEVRRLLAWLRLTGGATTDSGADALAHILFLKHERPDVYARTACLLEPMDYVNLRLTGKAQATGATVFPYLLTDNRDNTRIAYSDKLVRFAGVDRAKLPPLAPVQSIVGPILSDVAARWGLREGTPVVSGVNDSQAALLGSGAVADFAGHVCVGTTSWLTCHVPFKKTSLATQIATMPSAAPGRNMVVAEQGAAGKCLETFVEQWLFARDALAAAERPEDVYRRALDLAASVPAGSDGLLFLPWLAGAGPPSGRGYVRGGFLNQSLRTTRKHALRAIVEGVAMNLRWLHGAVEKFIGRTLPELNFIGGAAQSEFFCQTVADVLDRPIRQVDDPHLAIVRGAALHGWMTLGRLSLDDIPRAVRVRQVLEPNPANRQTYNDLFGEFLAAYRANRGMFARMNYR